MRLRSLFELKIRREDHQDTEDDDNGKIFHVELLILIFPEACVNGTITQHKHPNKELFFQLNKTESDLVKKCGEPLAAVNMGDGAVGAERGNSSKVNKRCAGT